MFQKSPKFPLFSKCCSTNLSLLSKISSTRKLFIVTFDHLLWRNWSFFSPTKLLKFDFSKKAPYSKLWLIFLTQIKSKVCRKLPPIHWRAHSFWFGNFEYLLANFEKVWRDCQEKKKSKWTKSWLSRPFCWVLFESKNH